MSNSNVPSAINTLSDAINKGIDKVGAEKKNIDARMVSLLVEAAKIDMFPRDEVEAIARRVGDKDAKSARFTAFCTDVMGYEVDDKGRLVDPNRRYSGITQALRRAAPVALRLLETNAEYELTKTGKLSIPHSLYATDAQVDENGARWASQFTPIGSKDGVTMAKVQTGCNARLGIKPEVRGASSSNEATTLNASIAFLTTHIGKVMDEDTRLTKPMEGNLMKLAIIIDNYIKKAGDDILDDGDDEADTVAADAAAAAAA